MSLLTSSLQLLSKYGKAAKVVVSGVLNVVAPGSGSLLDLAAQAIDRAGEVMGTAADLADKSQRDRWEEEMRTRLGKSEAELTRLGQLLECLAGPLAVLCDKAAVFADQTDDLPDIIARALAANPSLSHALHGIEGLKFQFDAFHADLRRVAQHQADALPVYERMNRVADYFDELWAAGIKPKDFAGSVLAVLDAAAATRDGDYPAAQRVLQTAVRLCPQDAGMAELSRRMTVLTTRATPKSRPPALASSAPPARLQPGDMLDGWALEKRLGAGGWGQVFQAQWDGQTRALKVMHPDYAADRAFVERFKKEIEALIRLPRHANLVGVEGFGYCTERQTWYLVMEHLDGPTLEKYLADKGPLTEAHVRKVFPDLIEGLAKAHAAGIAHRDIKPANLIFRRTDKRLVLVDFGLAVAVEKIGETQIGGISIAFAAPEQHYGESATQASDVFSLCAVIHYALHYDKPELRKPHCFTTALAPESLRQALTAGLRANVGERLQNGGELHAALLAGGPPQRWSTGAEMAAHIAATAGKLKYSPMHLEKLEVFNPGGNSTGRVIVPNALKEEHLEHLGCVLPGTEFVTAGAQDAKRWKEAKAAKHTNSESITDQPSPLIDTDPLESADLLQAIDFVCDYFNRVHQEGALRPDTYAALLAYYREQRERINNHRATDDLMLRPREQCWSCKARVSPKENVCPGCGAPIQGARVDRLRYLVFLCFESKKHERDGRIPLSSVHAFLTESNERIAALRHKLDQDRQRIEQENPEQCRLEEEESEWHYTQNGQPAVAPVNTTQLKQLASGGLLKPDDLVWREGMPNWAPAGSIPVLYKKLPR